jgi:urease accessory protein
MLVIERDQVCASAFDTATQIDLLAIDWYEVNKAVLSRETKAGRLVRVLRGTAPALIDEEIIHSAPEFLLKIQIKPCACILLKTVDMGVIGHFCFDVGNRHLPLFWFDDGLAFAYDGQLYPALKAQYGDQVVIEMRTLAPEYALQAYGS